MCTHIETIQKPYGNVFSCNSVFCSSGSQGNIPSSGEGTGSGIGLSQSGQAETDRPTDKLQARLNKLMASLDKGSKSQVECLNSLTESTLTVYTQSIKR